MYRLFLLLHFLLTWVVTLYIVFYFNIRMEDGGWNLNLFGVLFVFTLGVIGYKTLNKKMNIWEIQSRNKVLRAIISSIKAITFSGLVWWIWESLNNNYEDIHLTLMLVFFSIVLGAIFRFIGLFLQRKHNIKKATP